MRCRRYGLFSTFVFWNTELWDTVLDHFYFCFNTAAVVYLVFSQPIIIRTLWLLSTAFCNVRSLKNICVRGYEDMREHEMGS